MQPTPTGQQFQPSLHFGVKQDQHPKTAASTVTGASSPCGSHLFQLSEIEALECEKELANLKTNKSTGPDGIPAFILKSSAKAISHTVCSIIEASVAFSSFPSGWKHAQVKPLSKGGDKTSHAV